MSPVLREDQVRPPTSYLTVLKEACSPADLDLDAVGVGRPWRAASGAAHGKYWPTVELQHDTAIEDESAGAPRSARLPDMSVMGDLLKAAFRMTQYASLKCGMFAGADMSALYTAALAWVSTELSLREGVDRAELQAFASAAEERLRRAEEESRRSA